jgi:hypothetical protein
MHLSFLRPLYERRGPWASVVLDASHDTADATKALELRWRAAREELAGQGADEVTLAALENAILNHRPIPGRYALAAFAARGEVALMEPLPAPPPEPIAMFSPLPHAMPMVAAYGEQVSWLRVVADRTGADLLAATESGARRTAKVEGANDYPIRKVKPGGWSQLHYQHAAEENWDRNAEQVAKAVADLARSVDAEVIVVAGDVRARQLILENLPEIWQSRAIGVEAGSRAAGADPEPLDDATLLAIAEVADRHVDEALDLFRTQMGRNGAAGTGLAAIVTALQRGQVDTLLLVNDLSSTETLWVGDTPTEIAMSEAELEAMGTQNPRRVRADAALLRALAATDADLILVSPDAIDLEDGVGALLRYADASTRHH